MALNVTLSSLKEQVRDRADQQNSRFIQDPELVRYINLSGAALYDKLIEAAEIYTLNTYDIPIVGGTYEYDLPDDFYKVLGVDWYTNGLFYTMDPFTFQERNDYVQTPELQQVKLQYAPPFTPLVDDDDVLDGVNGWEERIIVDCAITCMAKEESETATLERQLAKIDDRLDRMTKNRDQGRPGVTTDVNNSRYWCRPRYGIWGGQIVFRSALPRNSGIIYGY